MRWFIYNVLFAVAYAAMLPKFMLRMRKRGGYKAHFAERFGRYDADTARRLAERRRLWIHAVSVGEANLAGTILRELRRRDPSASFVISTTSSTGRAVCEKLAGPDDVVIYLPLDFPTCVRRALRAINASALVLTESELWPNLLRAISKKGIPLVLANGRVSDRSAPGYRRLRFFFGPVLRLFDALLVQSETDRDRLVAAGAPPEKISVTGSVKFDIEPPSPDKLAVAGATLACAGIEPGRDEVLLGGSTWSGEESALARAWRSARAGAAPLSRLVLVPRHAERAPEVAEELRAAGFSVLRRSEASGSEAAASTPSGGDGAPAEPPVLLVDTTGELFALYAMADLVFVGKSLPPNEGGQNMIEPAALGRATIVGPHTENFVPVMERLRAAGALCEVQDSEALAAAVARLLGDSAERAALGERARAAVSASRGALARTVEAVRAVLNASVAVAAVAAAMLPLSSPAVSADWRNFVSDIGGELRLGGDPVRFVCADEPPTGDPALPARLAAAGFNMVKLSGIPPESAEDSPLAAQLDEFIYACRTNGIRVWAEVLRPCAAIPPAASDADLLDDPASHAGWVEAAERDGVPLLAAPWDARAEVFLQKRLREWARAFNAKTGLRRADDPTYAFFSLSSVWWNEMLATNRPPLPSFFEDELRAAWNNWLWVRHPDIESLSRAVGGLGDGESAEDGTVRFPSPGADDVSPLRRAEQRRFLFSLAEGHFGRLAARFSESGPATSSAMTLVRYGSGWTLDAASTVAVEKLFPEEESHSGPPPGAGRVPLVADASGAASPADAESAARRALKRGACILLLPAPEAPERFAGAAAIFRNLAPPSGGAAEPGASGERAEHGETPGERPDATP